MRVILTEDVPKLGNAGEVVRVRPGFGRNYLIPQGKAELATEGRLKHLEHQRRVIAERVRKQVGVHEQVARRLEAVEIEFSVQAGVGGKLFGSVTSADIQERLEARGFDVERRKIELSETIKELGDYRVSIRLHREVRAEIGVHVVAAEGSPAEAAARAEAAEPDAAPAEQHAGAAGEPGSAEGAPEE